MMIRRLLLVLCCCGLPVTVWSQTRLDEAPINYLETKGKNPVAKLIEKVESGGLDPQYARGTGYLQSILDELEIPVSSQVLVYSKTSLQSGRISPQNPRAIYFSDDTYVGWVQGSSLLEVSTADPDLGAVFYSFQMSPRQLYSRRENYRCLGCHEKTSSHGKMPMHTVRSVMTRDSGKINLLLREYVTDHSSPIEERWGGWYVTGEHGQMKHMGNAFLKGEELASLGPSDADTLRSQFDLSRWPSPSSDIVALMVMEHQTEMQNRLTDANYAVRRAKHIASQSDPQDGVDLDSVLESSAKLVVDYLLFAGEHEFESPIQCSNSFTKDFAAKGPRTKDGRSLRDFDLSRKLFRYPCSYQIYSKPFDGLDNDLKTAVYGRLREVLTGEDLSEEYKHLIVEDRLAVLEILKETKTDLPKNWYQ